VYESLLELHPELNAEATSFESKVAAGSERKKTGSYYTPTSLISCLLDSALDPVLDAAARSPEPEKAILKVKVVDPARGMLPAGGSQDSELPRIPASRLADPDYVVKPRYWVPEWESHGRACPDRLLRRWKRSRKKRRARFSRSRRKLTPTLMVYSLARLLEPHGTARTPF
jgi:hypothetical protein